ncbi:biotin synthase auxiliary protein BsaP [Kibdelosporangium persicum]|uniref:biotin synthase auxiliary protein BsaP n=1 Tax=Kibdelosporangium persicum TaxID=2698649 RepID=UPI00406BB1EA
MTEAVSYCGWCGKPDGETGHELCRRRLALVDPPRFCPRCARRMVVQVTPAGWTARCSRHGESTSAPATN